MLFLKPSTDVNQIWQGFVPQRFTYLLIWVLEKVPNYLPAFKESHPSYFVCWLVKHWSPEWGTYAAPGLSRGMDSNTQGGAVLEGSRMRAWRQRPDYHHGRTKATRTWFFPSSLFFFLFHFSFFFFQHEKKKKVDFFLSFQHEEFRTDA